MIWASLSMLIVLVVVSLIVGLTGIGMARPALMLASAELRASGPLVPNFSCALRSTLARASSSLLALMVMLLISAVSAVASAKASPSRSTLLRASATVLRILGTPVALRPDQSWMLLPSI